jgi:hypothetical protein
MVRVHHGATDKITAWRVRDALACHPLLGGASAHINIVADREMVVLRGWTVDERLGQVAEQLARRVAGRRVVHLQLRSEHCLSC